MYSKIALTILHCLEIICRHVWFVSWFFRPFASFPLGSFALGLFVPCLIRPLAWW